MENASKALIIAGAILLAISIIGIGMFIYSKSATTIQGTDFSTEQVAAYNQKFDNYLGTQSGSNVRALCDTIRNHNLSNTDDLSKQIVVTKGSAASKTEPPTEVVTAVSVNDIKTTVMNSEMYEVSFGYDKNTGYIIEVGIKGKFSK